MRRILLATALLAFTMAAPPAIEAQTTISARAASLRIGGRLHTQYQGSSIDGAVNDFFVRRARLIVDGSFNDFLSGRVQTDLVGGSATLLDAYLSMHFSDGFNLSVGQMKRSFDIFELSSSTDLSIVERDGRITGYSNCTGVGRVCSLSRLTEALRYAGRDVGVRIDGESGTFSYEATITNGPGVNVSDENDGKSFSGRSSVQVSEGVVVSANIGVHDYVDPMAETAYALAWGGDVQFGTWRDGVLLQAGLVGGDNWASLMGVNNDPAQFLAFQVIGSFYSPLSGERLEGIEPLLRVSVADPNGDIDSDGGTLITPGLMLYFMGKNKIGANVDYFMPGTGDSEFSFRLATFLYF